MLAWIEPPIGGSASVAKAAPEPVPNMTAAVAVATSIQAPELIKAIVTVSL